MTVAVARSRVVKTVPGGMSCLFGCVLRYIFNGAHDPTIAGIHLEMADIRFRGCTVHVLPQREEQNLCGAHE